MTRSDIVRAIVSSLGSDDIALFTTGMISREAFSAGDRDSNFYMLGSMGLLSSVALGMAMNVPQKRIIVVEGDGSALMSLGNFPLIGAQRPRNFYHIVIDNECYESTGGQPTVTQSIDLAQIAEASGYLWVNRISRLHDLDDCIRDFLAMEGPAFLLAKSGPEMGKQPSRVTLSPEDMKNRFMENLAHDV